MIFHLGTHQANWLWSGQVDCSLFVSRRRLAVRKKLKASVVPWCLDSGGFTELNLYGEWRTSEDEYLREIRKYQSEIGSLAWAAPQDWMCEPFVLSKTGKTVKEHQLLTIENFLSLRGKAPDLPIIPVLQGWARDDYLRHWELYERHGISLEAFPTVGVGSVCRRQSTQQGYEILQSLQPLKLHGFGFKTLGLRRCWDLLASADSLAWSYAARKQRLKLEECTHSTCNNCPKWATQWRKEILSCPKQLNLFSTT
jgi:hypothetical protein